MTEVIVLNFRDLRHSHFLRSLALNEQDAKLIRLFVKIEERNPKEQI